ncbi:hypothetical protein F2Q68_00013314 [Brassica cretica]|uniref:Reverse transcriptase zinc-binding domain-containing protein n=1 Tax=Brassica cretica TaxID=69181 RepID=A0A8S9HRR6_BRACR|nr:hypothetical protein F2Q68_00013314 [Brassica cretica]
MYREGSVIDLTLTIADLFIPGSHRWDESMVRRTFTNEDAELILKIKPNQGAEDSYKWGLTKDGVYSSKSGYRFFETLQNIVQPQRGLPPIEKKLWSSIWKIKAPSKLKHFLWKVLAGALAVKDRLRSRGIQLDTTCALVREAMLFPQRYVLVHGLVDSIHMMLTDLDGWQCVHVMEERNKPASEIAQSVINENRLSSYIARGGPRWLQLRLCAEATST